MKWSETYITRHARVESLRRRERIERIIAKLIIIAMVIVVILGIVAEVWK